MKTTFEKCISLCNELKRLQDQRYKLYDELEKESCEIIDALQKIENWSVLINDELEEEYHDYEDDFLEMCNVDYEFVEDKPILVFKYFTRYKDYTAFKIDLSKTLEEQINERQNEIDLEKKLEDEKKLKKEYILYQELKSKFEND